MVARDPRKRQTPRRSVIEGRGVSSQVNEASELSNVLNHALRGIMLGLHDIGERAKLAVFVLHILLKLEILQVELLAHLLHFAGRL